MSVTVTYNGQSLPGIIGPFSIQESYNEIGFSCTFLVESSSAGGLNSTCRSIEERLRQPFSDLEINFGGGVGYRFSHSDNTCLNPKGSFDKLANEYDTETSRMYRFSFRAGLPADKPGFNHRLTGDFTINQLATGQKEVRFSLVYTASNDPLRSSIQNFDEQALVYTNSVIDDLFSGTIFDILPIVRETDHNRKITSGTITYLQILEPESSAGHNDPNLKNVSATYSISREQRLGLSTGGYIPTPITKVAIRYSAELVAANFETREQVEQYYFENIKSHIIQRAIVNLNLENIDNTSSTVIVESDDLSISPTKSFLQASINFLAPSSLTDIIKLEETIREDFDRGLVTEDLWDGGDFTKSGYHLGSSIFVTRNIRVVQLSRPPGPPISLNAQDQTLVLRRATRSGVSTRLATNTDFGSQDIALFAEAFIELYEKAVIVNQGEIPIPNPNTQIFTLGNP